MNKHIIVIFVAFYLIFNSCFQPKQIKQDSESEKSESTQEAQRYRNEPQLKYFPKITRDRFDTFSGVYHNESIPLKILFTKDLTIYAQIEEAPAEMFGSRKEVEGKNVAEFAILGHHRSKAAFVVLLLEKGVGDISPYDYTMILKEVNKAELEQDNAKDIYMRGRGVYPKTRSLIFQVDLPCLNASSWCIWIVKPIAANS